jgi:hypothetical protein
VKNGRLMDADGDAGHAQGQHVEAACDACQHVWRVRGVVTANSVLVDE